jgi:hypothetical protein
MRLAFIFIALLLAGVAMATMTTDDFNNAKALVSSNTSCDKLGNSQLQLMGEYFMELMHPGEAHDAMDRMMGFEDNAAADEQFHINLGRAMYCNSGNASVRPYGMMFSGMMASGMMGNSYSGYGGIPRTGMMGYGYQGYNVFELLAIVLLIGLIILVYLQVWKKAKEKK